MKTTMTIQAKDMDSLRVKALLESYNAGLLVSGDIVDRRDFPFAWKIPVKPKPKKDNMKKAIKKILEATGIKAKIETPIDVAQVVADFANAEKALGQSGETRCRSIETLKRVMKERNVEVLVVPAAPDNSEVFMVYKYLYTFQAMPPNEVIKFERVKVEAV